MKKLLVLIMLALMFPTISSAIPRRQVARNARVTVTLVSNKPGCISNIFINAPNGLVAYSQLIILLRNNISQREVRRTISVTRTVKNQYYLYC